MISHKETLFAVLRHEQTNVVPWVPFAGVHAGSLAGFSAREVLTNQEKLITALLAVNRQYDPDGQPVVFDLQIEAEILGCDLLWAEKSPPAVSAHPFAKKAGIPKNLPERSDGRLPLVLGAMQALKRLVGDQTALYGLVTGPLTLASHLRGTEIFMDIFDQPDYLLELIGYCTKAALRMTEYYKDAGMDVIAVVDPVVSQISPKHFEQFLGEEFKSLYTDIRAMDVFSAFFVCGDATKNIEVMCRTAPDCIAVDENIDLVAAKAITDRYNIAIEGNIPLTSHMLLGTQQDNMKYVLDLMDALSPAGSPPDNLIISPGCDMPYDIPPENVISIMQAIREPETARLVVANYHAADMDLDRIILPDYNRLEKPLMEVFTLDSSTCPACGYMLSAAKRACEELAGAVDMREYKATASENIARMHKQGIRNLPSILINGELKFSSIIPSNRELIEEIRKYL
jgi:uroporphyrinogen decarboxylase